MTSPSPPRTAHPALLGAATAAGLDDATTAGLDDATAAGLDDATAGRLARIALGHVGQLWPYKLDHVLHGPADLLAPSALHPVFHGSFDWHSCVHAHWLLARVLRRFPHSAEAAAIVARFDSAFTPERVAGERAYLERPSAGGFERPYGWAWLLYLQVELEQLAEPRWAAALRPLAEDFAARFRGYLPRADYPVRSGTHGNTGFALTLAADWAEAHDPALFTLMRETAWGWFGADADCQAWEPSGEDFFSPALSEAACMARLLPRDAFAAWFDRFLPRLALGEPAALFTPARVADRSDGRIVHLDGLNLSRAWCFDRLRETLPPTDRRSPVLATVAEAHRAASLPHLDGDYMGAHWLASFAALALDAEASSIA